MILCDVNIIHKKLIGILHDIYNSSNKNQQGKKDITSNIHILEVFLWTQILKCTKLSQLSMLESAGMFLHHIETKVDGVFGSSRKNQPGTKDTTSNINVLQAKYMYPSFEMELNLALLS